MKQSRNRRNLVFPILCLLGVSTSVIWIRTSTVKETYGFVQTEKRLVSAKQKIQTLRLKCTRLTAPRKLVGYAKELALAPPRLDQIVKYSKLKGPQPKAAGPPQPLGPLRAKKWWTSGIEFGWHSALWRSYYFFLESSSASSNCKFFLPII